MKPSNIIVLSALFVAFAIETLALRKDVKVRMDCARGDCAGHRTLWKQNQNATLFKQYLQCVDSCVESKLHTKTEKPPPPALSRNVQ